MLVNSFGLPITMALTSGPTAPEATTFEPVDTTDMVDLKTGDFVYNLPLVEIPGPAGGYPLSLSYHAGIQPNMEASWTGLGFNLNPGSISRLVNGYPDDHYNVSNVDRSYWKGGTSDVKTVGISVGLANVASVSAGLSFAHDTYRGNGVGTYLGYGVGVGVGSGVGINASVTNGVSPYGDAFSSAGLSVGISSASSEALKLSTSVGIDMSAGKLNAGASTGVGVGSFSVLDASISTGGTKGSLSVGGGAAGVYNSRSNKISTNQKNFQIDVPVWYGVNLRLGRDYQRYWIDETQGVQTYGCLYSKPDLDLGEGSAFDNYDLHDISNADRFNDSELVLGGSFPDVDYYSVTGQGLSGNIKPYHYQGYIHRQKKDYVLPYHLNDSAIEKPTEFRFVNDFSNRFEYEIEPFELDGNDNLSYHFDSPYKTGRVPDDGNASNGEEDSGYKNNQLAGSKHVDWYTNEEIVNAHPGSPGALADGFINTNSEGFERSSDTQIGGFSITNESGVTYHYALPAYSYDEYAKSVNSATKQLEDGERWNEVKKPTKYAYTWFLTTVTGPDYVDRNRNGFADQGDWGYWVDFTYKKWIGDYNWRNPGIGTNKDLDGNFENFSAGKKEIYYLDRIVTESHVAVFEKSKRLDSREVSDVFKGGFAPSIETVKSQEELDCISECRDLPHEEQPDCISGCDANYPDVVVSAKYPRSLLRLDHIKLYNFDDYNADRISDQYLLRKISLSYDYSLCPGSPNSFAESLPIQTQGKLTLKSIKFFGKGGAESLIPPMTFSYGNNAPYNKDYYDVWGFYKSDYDQTYTARTNENMGRLTTEASAPFVDAWSLSKIESPLGADINIKYESDSFEKVVLERRPSLRISSVEDLGNNQLRLKLQEKVNLSKMFTQDATRRIRLVVMYSKTQGTSADWVEEDKEYDDHCEIGPLSMCEYFEKTLSGTVTIDALNMQDSSIIVEGESFYNLLKYEDKHIEVLTRGHWCDRNFVRVRWLFNGTTAPWPYKILAGTISTPVENERWGGGLRVKSIEVTNSNGHGRITEYNYKGGTTSYEPFKIIPPKIDELSEAELYYNEDEINFHLRALATENFYSLINISRQLPGPGVIYGEVEVQEKNMIKGVSHYLDNFAKYEFETYSLPMVTASSTDVEHLESIANYYDYKRIYKNTVKIDDYSSRIGNLKKVTLFNRGDSSIISRTTNTYLHENATNQEFKNKLKDKFNNQGLIQETFGRARKVQFKKEGRRPYVFLSEPPVINNFYFESDELDLLATISQLNSYPSVLVESKSENFLTGISNVSENTEFDFYSGTPTKVKMTDSYGNTYLSMTSPAYRNHSQMGLKVYDKANKNMLSQVGERYEYKVDNQLNPIGLLSAEYFQWSDEVPVASAGIQRGVWRPQRSFTWNGSLSLNADGTYPMQSFTPFDLSDIDNNVHWLKTTEVTLYDIYSHGLESKNMNDVFTSSRMNYRYDKMIASAKNASVNEFSSSGAEYYVGNGNLEGGVDRGEGNPSKGHVHSGAYSLLVGSNKLGFNFSLSSNASVDKNFEASVWVYAPGESETQIELDKIDLFVEINGVQQQVVHPTLQKNKSKSWYLLSFNFPYKQGDQVSVGVRNKTSRGIYFDDFRVHPTDAMLLSYVYDQFTGELIYLLDADNFYTKYDYDSNGRLLRTSKERLNYDFGDGKESVKGDVILNENRYNLRKQN